MYNWEILQNRQKKRDVGKILEFKSRTEGEVKQGNKAIFCRETKRAALFRRTHCQKKQPLFFVACKRAMKSLIAAITEP